MELDHQYIESLYSVIEMTYDEILGYVATGRDREEQVLTKETAGYKAAVISVQLTSFEEKYWWWKLFLMLERAVLAILVLIRASSWIAAGVTGFSLLASILCRPYHKDEDDKLDISVRLSVALTCLAACFLETKMLTGKGEILQIAKKYDKKTCSLSATGFITFELSTWSYILYCWLTSCDSLYLLQKFG